MEQYSFKDVTLHIFRTILEEDEFRAWPDVGIAIQTYLRDCERDLAELAEWARRRGTPVWVRLIKGAYWDFETVQAAQEGWPVPVFEHKWQTDDNYERLTLFLLENHDVLRPAFGSHNVRSLAHALAAAQVLGLPRGSIEFQMLYGMAEPIQNALVDLKQRLRIYTPYGQLLPGMAYLVRRLLENTANESFLRASFTEHVSEEKLLMKPRHQRSRSGARSGQGPGVRSQDRAPGSEYLTLAAIAFHNEPLCDFSQEANRQAMQAASRRSRSSWAGTYPLVIGGQNVTTEQLRRFAQSVAQARSRRPLRQGHVQTRRASHRRGQGGVSQMARHRPAEAGRVSLQGGRRSCGAAASSWRPGRFTNVPRAGARPTPTWPRASITATTTPGKCCGWPSRNASTCPARKTPTSMNRAAWPSSSPRGTFPLAILCGMTAAALVTGNTVIMKPAEQSAVIGAKLMEVFREAGLPAGVVNYLPGVGEEIGPTLAEHPDVALVAFTGSRGVGLLLNRQTAQVPRRPGPHQTPDRRAGRQERHHRRRRRRPGRGGAGRRGQCVRLPGTEMLGLFAGHRAGAGLRRFSGTA